MAAPSTRSYFAFWFGGAGVTQSKPVGVTSFWGFWLGGAAVVVHVPVLWHMGTLPTAQGGGTLRVNQGSLYSE